MEHSDYHDVELLLVEDNPNDAKLAARAFKKLDFPVKYHWVKDGEEALNFIFAEGNYAHRQMEDMPKVVLLDLKLPKVSGAEVLRKMREDKRTIALPVVVMTSSNEVRDIRTIYQLGTNSYVVKPVDFDDYMDTLKQVGKYWLNINAMPERT